MKAIVNMKKHRKLISLGFVRTRKVEPQSPLLKSEKHNDGVPVLSSMEACALADQLADRALRAYREGRTITWAFTEDKIR